MGKLETLQRLLKTKEILEKSHTMMTEVAKQRELNNIESAIYYLQAEIREEQRRKQVDGAEDGLTKLLVKRRTK
ncbi:MAG: hypothetical protein ACTSSF_00365 [Candidatus Heimdallarchaeaceae archaeon]